MEYFYKINEPPVEMQQNVVLVEIHVDRQLVFVYISMIQRRVDDLEL
jgi:hypothetical protein